MTYLFHSSRVVFIIFQKPLDSTDLADAIDSALEALDTIPQDGVVMAAVEKV